MIDLHGFLHDIGEDLKEALQGRPHHRVPAGTGANQLAPPLTSSTCPFSVQ